MTGLTEAPARAAALGAKPGHTAGRYRSLRARRLVQVLALAAIAFAALGIYIGFYVTPVEPHRGDLHRIVYIHVPATWMAILLFFLSALSMGIGMVSRMDLARMLAEASAPTGTMFAFMALWTGALWGKPIWGAWWIWDMRLAADLVLLLLYLSIIVTYAQCEDTRRADRIVGWIALAGTAVVLALLFSVALYPAVPGTPSHALPAVAAIRNWTGAGLSAMAASFACYSAAVILRRLRTVRMERQRNSDWQSRQFSRR